MDEQRNYENRPVNPRRRKRTQMQIFKEAYLPVSIAGVSLLLIFIFIIGSIVRGVQQNKYEAQVSIAASESVAREQERLSQEANSLIERAHKAAQSFHYEEAISILDSFSGNIEEFETLVQKRAEYAAAKDSLILWNDPTQVLNLSFQILIADPARAFANEAYGTSYNRNFVTTEEFTKILQQLYDNGYILIRMSDITSGTQVKDLYLPNGKKPLILTQTNVNYNTYMLDSDGDKLPDQGGAGFASKLIIDANGSLSCELVNSAGETVTGAYDLVPILDAFIETHPDFSYKGAKAILAVTGYDGLFGYRTNPGALEAFGQSYYDEQELGAKRIAEALRESGYEIACYTYENIEYGQYTAEQIQSDLNRWNDEVAPILGTVDTLVFARNSDIADNAAAYSGEKYNLLHSFGFTHYLGFCTEGTNWFTATADYVRQGRILVSGANMAYHADWFTGIFDPHTILDSTRGTIPE